MENVRIPTPTELKIIEDYIAEQKVWEADTVDEVVSLFLVLVAYGMEPQTALNNIKAIVKAMQNEYRGQ